MKKTEILKITIANTPASDGNGFIQSIEIETVNDAEPSAVDALNVLHEAIGQILNQIS